METMIKYWHLCFSETFLVLFSTYNFIMLYFFNIFIEIYVLKFFRVYIALGYISSKVKNKTFSLVTYCLCTRIIIPVSHKIFLLDTDYTI